MTRRTKQKLKIRTELFSKQGGLCYYCHLPMKPHIYKLGGGKVPSDAVTIEHLINPVLQSKKDKSLKIELVAAHASCNHQKAKEYQEQFTYFHVRKSVLGRKEGRETLIGKGVPQYTMFDGYYGA